MIKKVTIYTFLMFSLFRFGFAQGDLVTLQMALDSAVSNNPLSERPELLAQKLNLQKKRLSKHNLPDVNWITQATIQSENISLDIPIPSIEPVDLPLYNFNTYLESSYLVYDGDIKGKLIDNEKLKTDLIIIQY